jgi:hypothetical protein
MILLPLICLALTLGACSRGEEVAEPTAVPTEGSSEQPGEAAAADEDPVEVALAISAALDENPVNPANAIAEFGHSADSFEALMIRISIDPELSARYLAGRAAAGR